MIQMKLYMKSQILYFAQYKYNFTSIVLGYPNWENNEFANNEAAEEYAKHLTEQLKKECPVWNAKVFWDNEKFLLINYDGEEALKEIFY